MSKFSQDIDLTEHYSLHKFLDRWQLQHWGVWKIEDDLLVEVAGPLLILQILRTHLEGNLDPFPRDGSFSPS